MKSHAAPFSHVALAESLEVPVAHTLMGKGCMREDHPLLLGMTGFWGTPIANETCRTADLIVIRSYAVFLLTRSHRPGAESRPGRLRRRA